MSTQSEFSTRSITQQLKNQTDKRVSKNAADSLAEELDGYGEEIAEKAVEIANSEDRITVREEDMRKAILQHSYGDTAE